MAENNGDGLKIDGNLEARGVLFLTGEITLEKSALAANAIIRANMDPKTEFLQLMISSPGGSVNAGFALIDVMDWSALPIYTTGFGIVGSMGLSVLIAGEKGHRVVTPHTTLLAHRFSAISCDNYSGLVAKRKVEDLTHKRIVDHFLACSRLSSREEVEARLLKDVDTWLTPEEALDFGLVDRIFTPEKKRGAV